MRNLLIFVLVLIVIWWVRRALARPRGDGTDGGARGRHEPGARAITPERMVECAHCGVHIPESEGVREGGHFFCSDEHRRLGVRP